MVASERRYKEEIELLKAKVVQQKKEFDRKKEHLKEDMLRRQKQVLDDNKQLQNSLANKKEETEVRKVYVFRILTLLYMYIKALMSEVEVTGQAYEDVQEQNKRLLEQLKEKEDANIKLMSERIRFNSIQQLLSEEKELVATHLTSVKQEVITN